MSLCFSEIDVSAHPPFSSSGFHLVIQSMALGLVVVIVMSYRLPVLGKWASS